MVSNALPAATAVVLYCSNFVGLTLESVRGFFAVFIVWFLVNCVLLMIDNPRQIFEFPKRSRIRDWPKWAKWIAGVLTAMVITHFLAFVSINDWGAPQIKNGVYVLGARGNVIREITESEYISVKAQEMRLVFAFWLTVFLQLTFQWRFSKPRDTQADTSEERSSLPG